MLQILTGLKLFLAHKYLERKKDALIKATMKAKVTTTMVTKQQVIWKAGDTKIAHGPGISREALTIGTRC